MKIVPCQLRKNASALLVRRSNPLVWLALRLPMWVPVYVFAARCGQDTLSYRVIGLCPIRNHRWS